MFFVEIDRKLSNLGIWTPF